MTPTLGVSIQRRRRTGRVPVGTARTLLLALCFWAAPAMAQTGGTSVAPFTTLFQWNRGDLSQFTIADVGTSATTTMPAGLVRTTQPDATYSVIPAAEFSVASGSGGPQKRFIYTNDTFAPQAGEDLVVEADLYYDSWPLTNPHGLGCFDPANPTSNFYVVTHTDGSKQYSVIKVINGTTYTQAAATYVLDNPSLKMNKARIRYVLTSAGRFRIYMGGYQLMDLPMTLGNATTLTNCKVGFAVYGGSSTTLAFSRLRVFRITPLGEQVFKSGCANGPCSSKE